MYVGSKFRWDGILSRKEFTKLPQMEMSVGQRADKALFIKQTQQTHIKLKSRIFLPTK